MRRFLIFPLLAALLLLNSACLFGHHKNINPLAGVNSAQPDKDLFDKAMTDLAKGKFTVSRLLLQTLINSYPDSEYLARAKMAIADSWYREGGTEGLAQAEAEYRDFITFFPTMKEAQEAQLKIAEIHFRQLQKPDRDDSNALQAEQDLRTFLQNYPSGPMADKARAMLRDVDEVLADGEFRIGSFYVLREEYRAAQSRLQDVVNKYPLYSRGDEAMAMLARSYLTTSSRYAWAAKYEFNPMMKKLMVDNENNDRALATGYYTRLIERYPLSPEVREAKKELAALHAPIPKPTPEAIAFNRREIAGRTVPSRFEELTSIFRGRPITELDRADKVGNPPMGSTPAGAPATAQAEITALTSAPATNNAASADAAATPSAASGALQLQSVGSGGFQDPNTVTTPTATEASDVPNTSANVTASVVNQAIPGAPKIGDDQTLTPDELDRLQHEQLLADEVHRSVPYPRKVKLNRKQRQMLEKLRKEIPTSSTTGAKSAKTAAPAQPPSGP